MEDKDFQLLYETNYRTVYQYLLALSKNHADAEDLTQEAFLAFEKKYLPSKEKTSDYTLLCRIGKNLWLNKLRKEKKRIPVEIDQLQTEESFEDAVSDRFDSLRIHETLHQLKEPYKEVFMLRIFGELSFSKIASLFGKSESWAKMTFYRAKRMIIQKMEGPNEGE